ncbi:hypothetical protein JCM24511_06669 [Saitozyma sp. JCM 24511]|nr:hypothetical protein JCM24511_06669 [Saitozyma sp. JCM 24511]
MILSFTVTAPRPLIPSARKVLAERPKELEVGMNVHLVAGVERLNGVLPNLLNARPIAAARAI